MTEENILKLHKHFTTLAEGKFNERTFDFELKAKDPDNSGSSHVGKMSGARIDLIRSDAARHKKDMEEKYPDLFPNPEPVPLAIEEPAVVEEPEPKKRGRKKKVI